ncbi:MAG TPA: glutaminyl-peptide cyclotransferase [Vicinamibacterales bacterium]|nr:glutaminyl-peptide cyclotransferase [Vicinamibacterales bacterium]
MTAARLVRGTGRSAGGRRPPAVAGGWVVVLSVLIGVPGLVQSLEQKPQPAEQLRVQVIRSYPHDRGAFTQGLLLDNGKLLESTGQVGQSSLREVELATGRVIRKVDVPPPLFAEGLALVGDTLIQLTWQHGRALLYNKHTFARVGEFSYRGEGWGLCTAGDELVMSDGSSNLTFRRSRDFSVIRTLAVTLDGQRFDQLNELECVDGDVYANVWMRDMIVRIDARSGRITQQIAAPNLLSPLERQGVDVMNGIAYDPSDQTFLITGKLWPKLFRVKFVKAAS